MKSLITFITEKQNFLIKGHTINQTGAVDLDLPSGLKWASCNIGANKPEEPGLLFQFGRVDGYKYNDNNHNFLHKKSYMPTSGTEYEKGNTLNPEDDAAYQATNGRFRMPTTDEIDELVKYTEHEWIELNGVKGRKFISKKNDSKWIFIPAAGYFDGYEEEFDGSGFYGYVWSSSVKSSYDSNADFLHNSSKDCDSWLGRSFDGLSVRGVLNK